MSIDLKLSLKPVVKSEYQLSYPWLSIETQPVKCVLCNDVFLQETYFTYSINDHLFHIRHCKEDDLFYTSPQPSGTYFLDLYNHPSYYQGTDDMYGMEINEEKSSAIAIKRIEEILSRLSPAPKRFLEVGCAYGHTLIEATKRGIDTVIGLEFSNLSQEVCTTKNLRVLLGDLDGKCLPLTSEQFDCVACYSVLEHAVNPLHFLESLCSYTAQNGTLVLRIPIITPEGPWLSLLDHLWHFTERSFTALVEHTGFTVVDCFPSGIFSGRTHPGHLQSVTYFLKRKTNL